MLRQGSGTADHEVRTLDERVTVVVVQADNRTLAHRQPFVCPVDIGKSSTVPHMAVCLCTKLLDGLVESEPAAEQAPAPHAVMDADLCQPSARARRIPQ